MDIRALWRSYPRLRLVLFGLLAGFVVGCVFLFVARALAGCSNTPSPSGVGHNPTPLPDPFVDLTPEGCADAGDGCGEADVAGCGDHVDADG